MKGVFIFWIMGKILSVDSLPVMPVAFIYKMGRALLFPIFILKVLQDLSEWSGENIIDRTPTVQAAAMV